MHACLALAMLAAPANVTFPPIMQPLNPAAEINSFCDQLIRLAAHQPAKGRTMSARKEFNHLMRSMPLSNTIMPAMSCLTVPLPPPPSTGGDHGKGGAQHAQQHELVTIEGIVDTIEVMTSLQKPKKARTAPCMQIRLFV
jgi:hypothetical protein